MPLICLGMNLKNLTPLLNVMPAKFKIRLGLLVNSIRNELTDGPPRLQRLS